MSIHPIVIGCVFTRTRKAAAVASSPEAGTEAGEVCESEPDQPYLFLPDATPAPVSTAKRNTPGEQEVLVMVVVHGSGG